jgi:hypothetical protein
MRHKLAVPADPEFSPCTTDCPACQEERVKYECYNFAGLFLTTYSRETLSQTYFADLLERWIGEMKKRGSL